MSDASSRPETVGDLMLATSTYLIQSLVGGANAGLICAHRATGPLLSFLHPIKHKCVDMAQVLNAPTECIQTFYTQCSADGVVYYYWGNISRSINKNKKQEISSGHISAAAAECKDWKEKQLCNI